MDEVRKLIKEQTDKARYPGRSLAWLSKECGKSHSYFQQFVDRGVPRELPESIRGEVARVLDVDENQLRGPSSRTVKTTAPIRNARIAGRVTLNTTIPAYGHAMGGKDGQFILNGNKVADVLAPASLSGVPDAYAVYVAGNSMEIRYFAGEVVYVNPRLPVRRGDFVVAQIAASEGEAPYAYVKRFVTMDELRLKLEQFNPKKTLTFPRSQVVSVHKIIMGGDG